MHRNAPLTPEGRFRLCLLIEDGWTVAAAAESMRISRQTAHKWWRPLPRSRVGPVSIDRSSRPRRCPTKTPRSSGASSSCGGDISSAGPAGPESRSAGLDAAPRSGSPRRVSALDLERRAGRVVRRIETSRPGELVHIDIKKQAKIPAGGGWRVNGLRPRTARTARPAAPTRLRLRPLGHRRLLPSGLLRDPCQRAGHHRGGLLEAGSGLLRLLRHHRRTSDDRQRRLLSLERLPTNWWPRPSSTPGPSPTARRPTGK